MQRHDFVRVSLLAWLVTGWLLVGCGDDSPNPSNSVSGNSNKAPISGAIVTVHHLDSDASVGSLAAGPYTTNAAGDWGGTTPADISGPLVVVSTGGSYRDEATGNVVFLDATDSLYGVFQGAPSAVTPLTHTTFLAIQARVAGGMPLATAISEATNASVTGFGFNFTTTIPDSDGTANASKYADLLGGLSRLVNNDLPDFANTPRFDLVIAIATDMVDGKLDGLDATGAEIQVPTNASGSTTAPLPGLSELGLSGWLTEANVHAGSTVFNVNTIWNPVNTGGLGGNLGSVDYVTVNTSIPSGTATPDTVYATAGPTWSWIDRANQIELEIVLANQALYPGKVEAVYFSSNGGAWSSQNVTGVQNITVSGGTTTFDNTGLHDLDFETSVNLSGTLTNPP